jgi:hypothetical protein
MNGWQHGNANVGASGDALYLMQPWCQARLVTFWTDLNRRSAEKDAALIAAGARQGPVSWHRIATDIGHSCTITFGRASTTRRFPRSPKFHPESKHTCDLLRASRRPPVTSIY